MTSLSTTTEVVNFDSRTLEGYFLLPKSSDIPNRILTLKDTYGNANISTITVYTQYPDTFEDGSTSYALTTKYEAITLCSGSNTWQTLTPYSPPFVSTVSGLATSGYISTTTAKTNFVQAVLTTHQTIPYGVDTTIQFTDDIDPNNWWNSSTYRFQPTIAGYYQWNVQVWWQAGVLNGTNQTNIQVRKNGTSIAIAQTPVTSTIGISQTFSRITQLNGTTDYLDVTAFTGNTTSQVLNGGVNGTYFYATLQ